MYSSSTLHSHHQLQPVSGFCFWSEQKRLDGFFEKVEYESIYWPKSAWNKLQSTFIVWKVNYVVDTSQSVLQKYLFYIVGDI